MNTPIHATVPRELELKAAHEFYPIYGLALGEWSRLENSLYFWFAHVTKMKHPIGRAIFFSAKSFASRAEMLEAAIEHQDNLSKHQLELIEEIIKKARKYSAFRNRITHGEPRFTGLFNALCFGLTERGDFSLFRSGSV